MTTLKGIRWLARALLTLALAAGCTQQEPDTQDPVDPAPQAGQLRSDATLTLAVASLGSEEIEVDLHFNHAPGHPGPRMMELFIAGSEGTGYLGSEPLAATLAAGKDLVVQEADDGNLRVVIFATDNLNELESGPLARFRLSRPQTGQATLALVDRQPIFAPAEASRGVTLDEPLVVDGP